MTLHPWPSNDGPNDHDSVLWKNGSALGLLADALAVPLRFASEGLQAPAPAPVAAGLQTFGDAALLRVREFEARIGCVAA